MMMAFDFTSAKMKHSAWKIKVRGFLDGRDTLPVAQAVSHKDCELGKWLYSEGLSKYGQDSDMRKLASEHEKLHRTIKQIVEMKEVGKKAEAEQLFATIEPTSKIIIDLLTTMDRKLAVAAT